MSWSKFDCTIAQHYKPFCLKVAGKIRIFFHHSLSLWADWYRLLACGAIFLLGAAITDGLWLSGGCHLSW